MLGHPQPGKQRKNAGLYLERAQHPPNTGTLTAHEAYPRIQCKQISPGFDIKIDYVFVAHFGYAYVGVPLVKSPFMAKKNVAQLGYFSRIFQDTKQTPQISTSMKRMNLRKKNTILGRYHGIQVSPGFLSRKISGFGLQMLAKTWVPRGLHHSALMTNTI